MISGILEIYAALSPEVWLIASILLSWLFWTVWYLQVSIYSRRPFYVVYLIWILFIDKAPWTGSRKTFYRLDKLVGAHYIRDYITFNLVKTADLDPSEGPFLFGLHPHGVLGYSHWTLFSSFSPDFTNMFPKIQVWLCTLNLNFYIPFARELLLARGMISADKKAIGNLLKTPCSSVALVVGGAAESQYAHPGMHSVILKKRRGFIRLAIQNGASLVPVYSFGENTLFKQVKHPWLNKIQRYLTKKLTFCPIIFYGRWGTMVPFRSRVTSVVGKPVKTVKNPNPTASEVDRVQKEYIEALTRLFNENKEKYCQDPNSKLILVA